MLTFAPVDVVIFVVYILIFLPIYFRRKIYTIPEYLERRYSSLARTIFSVMTLVSYLVINLAGVRGIVFAGLVAAIMSTLSSLINSIATLFSMDIYHKFIRPKASEKHLIRVGQLTGALLLVSGTLWSPVVGTFPA